MKKKKILYFTKYTFITLSNLIKFFFIMILITGLQHHIYAKNIFSDKTKLLTLHISNTSASLLSKNNYFILLNNIINIYYKPVNLTKIIINDIMKVIINPYDIYHVNHININIHLIELPINNNTILHYIKFIFLDKIICTFILIKNLINIIIYNIKFNIFITNKCFKQNNSFPYINYDIKQINIKKIYKNQIDLINRINILKKIVTKTIKTLWMLQLRVNQISIKHIKKFQNNVMILNNKFYINIMTIMLNNNITSKNVSENKKISYEILQYFRNIQLLQKYQKIASIPVYYGKYSVIKIGLYETVYVTVLRTQEKNIHILYHVCNNKILAPIYKNQILGYMCFMNKNHILKIYPLVALNDVPLGNCFIRFLDYVRLILSKWLNQ